jgi:hypothetical protein
MVVGVYFMLDVYLLRQPFVLHHHQLRKTNFSGSTMPPPAKDYPIDNVTHNNHRCFSSCLDRRKTAEEYTFQVDRRGELNAYRAGLSQCPVPPRGQPTLPSTFHLPTVLVESKCELILLLRVCKNTCFVQVLTPRATWRVAYAIWSPSATNAIKFCQQDLTNFHPWTSSYSSIIESFCLSRD